MINGGMLYIYKSIKRSRCPGSCINMLKLSWLNYFYQVGVGRHGTNNTIEYRYVKSILYRVVVHSGALVGHSPKYGILKKHWICDSLKIELILDSIPFFLRSLNVLHGYKNIVNFISANISCQLWNHENHKTPICRSLFTFHILS